MIDTVAKTIAVDTAKVIAKDAVEQARDVVQERLVELHDRLADASPVIRRRGNRRRVTTRALILVLIAGGVAAAIVVWRRRATTPEMVAPDAFGEAVEEERAAHLLGEPATR